MVWWALSSCVATVSAVYTYTFCDSTVPDGLRVSSGSYTFGDSSTDYNCLAATVSQSTTVSRLDTGGASWEDVRLSETWWQQTFTRDHLLCVRTQTAATTTWTGVDAWTSAENGYCCRIATSSSSLSYLEIEKRTGSTVSTLATGSTFSTSDGYGEDVLYTFEAQVIGDTITCTYYDEDGTELSSVSKTDSTYSSGGAAFMVVRGDSLTHYLGMSVTDLAPTALPTLAPTALPTLAPTLEPTLLPTPEAYVCEDGYDGGGWTLYLYNGADAQWKNALRYGTNSEGFGAVYTTMPTSGAAKMGEDRFDLLSFTELLAVGNGVDWVTISKVDGSQFYASEAFAVSNSDTAVTITRGDTGAVVTDSTTNALHGPFYHDLFGNGYGWMWTDNSGTSDLRKGTVYGGSAESSYSWAWYGQE